MRIYVIKNKSQKQPFAAVFSQKVFLSRCFFRLHGFVFFRLSFSWTLYDLFVKLKIWRFCQRIKYSIFFFGLIGKGWSQQLKSNFKVRSFSGWKYSMTVWMKYSMVHCKLKNKNQEEKFYWEILKNSNLPINLNFFVYEYKRTKYSNFKCNKHGRLNKLHVNSEENF